MTSEDLVAVALHRRMREVLGDAKYERFLKRIAKQMAAAELLKNDRRPLDLTAREDLSASGDLS